MAQDIPLLEYTLFGSHTFGEKMHLRLFEGGLIVVVKQDYLSGERRLPEVDIGHERVDDFAKRLVGMGFFDFDDHYTTPTIRDGLKETLLLRYQGKQKAVTCENQRPASSEFEALIEELNSLMQRSG